MRPEPSLITDALKFLQDSERIKLINLPGIKTPFYALSSFSKSNPKDKARYSLISTVYPNYRELAEQDKFCGDILEIIMFKAALNAHHQIVVGTPERKASNITINSIFVKNQPPVDLLLFDPLIDMFIGVETKNWREWVYPHDEVIRTFLKKCLVDNLAPVFITRRLPYITRVFFRELGILGFQTFFQYWHPDVESSVLDFRRKDGLGFADMRCSIEPQPYHVRFFQNNIPANIQRKREQFLKRASLIEEYVNHKISYGELGESLGIFRAWEIEEFEPDVDW